MGWTAKQPIAEAVVVAEDALADAITGDDVSSAVSLNPGEVAHVEVEYDPPTTPTDDLVVAVQTTLDGDSENWDDEPYLVFTIPNTPDPCKRSFTISQVYRWRLVFYMTGSTDTTGTATAHYRTDGVSG